MSYRLHLRIRCRLLRMTVLTLYGLVITGTAVAACYKTPDAAIQAFGLSLSLLPVSNSGGYRVTGFQSDPLLGDRWATISSCDHPDRPVILLQLNNAGKGLSSSEIANVPVSDAYSLPIVRVGDIVRLWREEDLLRIETTGVSEENGSLGKRIRVRMLRRNIDEQSTQGQFFGIVRGPADVEMQP
jgi:hypothetical protein